MQKERPRFHTNLWKVIFACTVCLFSLWIPQAAMGLPRFVLHVSKVGSHTFSRPADINSIVPIASGIVTLEFDIGAGYHFSDPKPNVFRFQFMVDDQPVGTPIDVTARPVRLSWDSRTVADGTHVLSARLLEIPADSLILPFPAVVVVDNVPGPVTGPQAVPVCPFWDQGAGVQGDTSFRCDWVTYSGTLPTLLGHPQPVVKGMPFTTPPVASDLYVERIVPMLSLHKANPRFFQTKEGHVVALLFNTQGGEYYNVADEFVDHMPISDGPRNIGYITAYINGVVHPVTEELIFVEMGRLWGRLGKIALDGTVTTVAGFRTRSGFVPYMPDDLTIPNSQRLTQFEKVGTFTDGPLRFARPMDVAIDPRNPDIAYVADSENHRIAKVRLSTGEVSTYAGSRTGEEGYHDGPGDEALFCRQSHGRRGVSRRAG